MPTGDLPGQAETFGVSNVAIYLSITLFVAGFGIGPLLFAPCKCQARTCVTVGDAVANLQCQKFWVVNPYTPFHCFSTLSSLCHHAWLRIWLRCSRAVW